MRLTAVSLAFSLLLAACGSSDSDATPAADTGVAADSSTADSGAGDVATNDAATDTSKPDATCDVGAVPTVAPFTSEFVFIDADAGVTFPAPTGGDPTGAWRYSKITIYLTPDAKSVLDVSKSSISGWGYASYTGTNFVNALDQKFVLETTVVGTITRGTVSKAKGAFKAEGNELVYTPACAQSTGDAGPPRVGFSRLGADKARLQFKPAPTGMGDFNQQIVIDLELVK